MEAASKKQKNASKGEDPWELGYAHLEVADALIQRSSEWTDFQNDAKSALSEADEAIEIFSTIPHPGGIASAHLARASIYTELADKETDEQKKVAGVDRALTACLAAQEALNAEEVDTGQLFDTYSAVSILLLLLREMINDQEYQDQFDELIVENSKLLGETVAADVRIRAEGNATLLTAQMIEALAEVEEDQAEKEDLLLTKQMLAIQAGHWLQGSSDSDLIDQALQTYHNEWPEHKGVGDPPLESKKGHLKCQQCGSANPPGAKFCNECGAAQKKVG